MPGVDLTTQLEIIYGKAVVDDIKKERERTLTFLRKKKEETKTFDMPFSSFEELREILFYYLFETHKTNYYENHPYYTRFVLITLEIFNHDSSNSFIDLLTKTNEVWQIEHIIPQSRKQELKKPSLVNSLGNLSLITRDVNNSPPYSTADFQIKGDYLKNTIEENMFLNKCFKEYSDFSDNEIKIREEYLLEKFYEIFSKNIPYTNKDDFSIDSLIEKLNLKES